MPKLIQVKDVPDEVHRILKSRAALAGLSLNEYLRQELTHLAGRPTRDEVRQMLEDIEPHGMSVEPSDVIRQMRDAMA